MLRIVIAALLLFVPTSAGWSQPGPFVLEKPTLENQLSRALRDKVEVTAIRSYGPLALVEVNYPLRANNNAGYLVLNGRPSVVDAETLVQAKPDANPGYKKIKASHPQAEVWPTAVFSRVTSLPGGGQRFVFVLPVLDGCHALR